MNQVLQTDWQAGPVLKWAGGKGRLLAEYDRSFPRRFQAYFEPFVGGAAVFFHLAPRGRVRLTDINEELINLYRVLQSRVEELIDRLADHRDAHSPDYYYAMRALQPSDLGEVERAARLVYLNKTCFNGLYRVNSRGQFNVPLGRYANPSILRADRLRAASRALARAELAVEPFHGVLQQAGPGDLVYFDPPYQPLSATSNFTTYTKETFGEREQTLLRDVFVELAGRGVHVMLSNSDAPLIRELYRGYKTIVVQAPRMINSKADRREAIGELLILGKKGRRSP